MSNHPHPFSTGVTLADGTHCHRYRIAGADSESGSDAYGYTAWQPISSEEIWTRYSRVTVIEGQWYGALGTERLPAELEALPAGLERLAKVTAWQDARALAADRILQEAFDELGAWRPSQHLWRVERCKPHTCSMRCYR